MFRYLLICLMLFTGSAHAAEDDFLDAVKKAAEQGQVDAQLNLGVRYARGDGVTQDYAEAERWFRQAAEQGHAGAQNNLGVMYDKGEGVPEDDAEAVSWYRQAAEQGDAECASTILVSCTPIGEGVPEDDIQAYAWISLASAQGVGKCQKRKRKAYWRNDTRRDCRGAETFTQILG